MLNSELLPRVFIVLACLESFSFGAERVGFVVFEQIEGDAVDEREVSRGVDVSVAKEAFAEADFEHTVQLVFDSPLPTEGQIQTRRILRSRRWVWNG
jgi:hypothetical protein